MLGEWIKNFLENDREARDPRRIGLSSAGKCGRQLAYKYHGTEGIPLTWRTRSIFDDGNLIQDQLRQWIHLSDKPECYYLSDEETEVKLETPKGRTILGHVDGIIWHRSELSTTCKNPDHETKLLEIKSMSSTGFRMLGREGLEKSYIVQVNCYLEATKLKQAVVLCKNKDTSDLRELVIDYDPKIVRDALEKLDKVLESIDPDMVDWGYRPKEDGSLPWNCGYCPYVATCWKKYSPREKEDHKWVLDGDYKEIG